MGGGMGQAGREGLGQAAVEAGAVLTDPRGVGSRLLVRSGRGDSGRSPPPLPPRGGVRPCSDGCWPDPPPPPRAWKKSRVGRGPVQAAEKATGWKRAAG